MCGIVAVVGERRDHRWVPPMIASLRARGPDGEGTVERDWFVLAFRRLAIVASASGAQPVSAPDGLVTLAFNGEIYNYEELARELRARGTAVRCEADALLALYLAEGDAFVAQLDGDYAIVVCDARSRTCRLFRDPFGVKPLYYAPVRGGRTWAVASEVQAFFHHPGFTTDWDVTALAERRVLGFCAWDRTNFLAVRQVPPGGIVTLRPVADGDVAEPVVTQGASIASHSAEALDLDRIDEQCARILERAVGRRVRHSEHFPVVVALSGGIDSSILARFAADFRASMVASVTLAGADDGEDERISARVASGLSLRHRCERTTVGSLLESFPRLVLALGAQGPAYSAFLLAAAIRRHAPDSKVMLCGEGADELFSGYWMHAHPAQYAGRARAALRSVPADTVAGSPLLRTVAGWRTDDEPHVRAELGELLRTHQLVNRHLVPFDHATMAYGLECRVPFLDGDVARWIAAIPAAARTHGGTSKLLLRLVVRNVLRASGLDELVLARKPSPLRAALGPARAAMVQRLRQPLAASNLERTALAAFAAGPEELFWLAAVDAIFMRRRGAVDGMTFDDLQAEALRVAV